MDYPQPAEYSSHPQDLARTGSSASSGVVNDEKLQSLRRCKELVAAQVASLSVAYQQMLDIQAQLEREVPTDDPEARIKPGISLRPPYVAGDRADFSDRHQEREKELNDEQVSLTGTPRSPFAESSQWTQPYDWSRLYELNDSKGTMPFIPFVPTVMPPPYIDAQAAAHANYWYPLCYAHQATALSAAAAQQAWCAAWMAGGEVPPTADTTEDGPLDQSTSSMEPSGSVPDQSFPSATSTACAKKHVKLDVVEERVTHDVAQSESHSFSESKEHTDKRGSKESTQTSHTTVSAPAVQTGHRDSWMRTQNKIEAVHSFAAPRGSLGRKVGYQKAKARASQTGAGSSVEPEDQSRKESKDSVHSEHGMTPKPSVGSEPSDRGNKLTDIANYHRPVRESRSAAQSASLGTWLHSITSLQRSGSKRNFPSVLNQMIFPREDDRDLLFKAARAAARHGSNGIFFGHLHLRSDGGFGKDNIESLLFNNARAIQVMLYLALVPFNFFAITFTLYWVWYRGPMPERLVLLLNSNTDDAGTHFWYLLFGVILIEFVCMVIMMIFSSVVIIQYWFTSDEESFNRFRIWNKLYTICCLVIPEMTNFSALKALAAIHPQVILSTFYLYLTKAEQGHSLGTLITKFAFSRLCFGLLGFVSFTVKFAELATRLKASTEDPFDATTLAQQMILLVGFLNQALGVVQIWQVENNRVFLLIFGGEDSALQTGEIDRQHAFLAYAVYTVCKTLFVNDPWRTFKRAVALLGFSHFDVQSLVLIEDEGREIDADTIRQKRESFGLSSKTLSNFASSQPGKSASSGTPQGGVSPLSARSSPSDDDQV